MNVFFVNQVCDSMFNTLSEKEAIGKLWRYKDQRQEIFEWLYLNCKETFYKYLPNIVGMSRIDQESIRKILKQYILNLEEFEQYYTALREIVSHEEFNSDCNWKILDYFKEKYHDDQYLNKEIITLYKYKKK